MGIGREMYYDLIAVDAFYWYRAKQALANGVWLTRDGREVPVREMTDSHLANSIRMMQRGGSGLFEGMAGDALEMLLDEARRRGEMIA